MYQPQQQHQSATVMLHQHQQPGTGVLYTVTGQPVTFTSASQVCESYNSRQSVIVGIILIITGIMSIVWNAFAIIYGEVISELGSGILCGVLFIIAGAFGILAARKNRCQIIAFMVLAIIAASLAFFMFIMSVIGALIGDARYRGQTKVGIMCALMAATAVIAAAAAIWGSVLACKVHQCCSTTPMVVGSNQPIVIFSQQPQQPYMAVPQADQVITSSTTGPPPAYTTLVGYPAMSQSGHHSSPAYNPASAAASAASLSVCDGGDVLPSKM